MTSPETDLARWLDTHNAALDGGDRFSLAQANVALTRLRQGQLQGAAVLMPNPEIQ